MFMIFLYSVYMYLLMISFIISNIIWASLGENLTFVVTVPFLTASLLGLLFSDMVRVVDCHAGVLGSNPGGPKRFSPWNYFTGGSGNSVAPEAASGSGSGIP